MWHPPDSSLRRRTARGKIVPKGGSAVYWVYILRCADGTLYTGITNDLPRRLAAARAALSALPEGQYAFYGITEGPGGSGP